MKGVISRAGVLTAIVAIFAGSVAAGAVSASPRSGAPAPACDPALELCLLDDAPWVSPQEIHYRGPVAVDSLKVRLKQGSKNKPADGIEVASQDATTKTWRAVLPARLKNENLKIIATTDDPGVENRAEGRVRPVIKRSKLRIAKDGTKRVANLRFGSRGQVRAIVRLELIAKYPAEKSERVKKWKVKKTLPPRDAAEVRVKTDNVERLCKRYSRCRLKASAQLKSTGYGVGRHSDKSKVPTPPERFQGSLGFVPGSASSGGGGRAYSYAVYVENGIKIDRKDFAKSIGKTLGDRRGWTRTGRVNFRQVSSPSSANTRVILASPNTVDRLCAPLNTAGYVSCTQGSSIVLNLNRWRYAVPHFNSRLEYRRMVTNHEMGHRIGHGHRNCSGRGNKAPVMQQQTYGLQGCRANAWPLNSEVASARAAHSG